MATAEEQRPFGVLLQRHRVAAGLSQEELAERAGLSRRGISDLERGTRRSPYPATVRRLAQALGLPDADRAVLQAAGRRPGSLVDSGAPSRPNLPLPLTSFVGRDRQVTGVRRLLGTTRLLTLTGPGGVGKTRLALHAAANLLDCHPDGTWFVDLTPLVQPELVTETVAAVLEVPSEPGRPVLDTLISMLSNKVALVVLDNCEHLVEACAQVADRLLRSCPNLQLLATSRETLGIAGERTWEVPPLSLCDPRHLPTIARLAQCEAVQLFIDRARAVQPSFVLTDANAAPVARICYLLDGLPLAIELAAARVRMLTPAQIAQRLERDFQLLTGGGRTTVPRQQTLRATLEWSYDLLTHAEQVLFRRLSVFAGGWDLDAAEEICAGGRIKSDNVLELLGRLVDKSLVEVREEQGGVARYRLLETLRQFAAEHLRKSADASRLRDLHLSWFICMAEHAAEAISVPRQAWRFKWFQQELDNLRVALDYAVESGNTAHALRLGAALRAWCQWPLWRRRWWPSWYPPVAMWSPAVASESPHPG